MPSLKRTRQNAASSMSRKGLLVTGGRSEGVCKKVRKTSEILDTTGLWVEGPSLPQPTFYHCQVTVDSDVYVLGMFLSVSATIQYSQYYQEDPMVMIFMPPLTS